MPVTMSDFESLFLRMRDRSTETLITWVHRWSYPTQKGNLGRVNWYLRPNNPGLSYGTLVSRYKKLPELIRQQKQTVERLANESEANDNREKYLVKFDKTQGDLGDFLDEYNTLAQITPELMNSKQIARNIVHSLCTPTSESNNPEVERYTDLIS